MNLFNKGDIWESITKLRQRGIGYFLSKATLNEKKRTKSTFGQTHKTGSNWWIIPEVKQRENIKISGDPGKTFDVYLAEKYFHKNNKIRLLSVACGTGNREIRMAESNLFEEIHGIDLSDEFIREANQKSKAKKLGNIHFEQADFYSFKIRKDYYDIVLFHSALHHFKNIQHIARRVNDTLKDEGYLILNEYVGKNRLQFTKAQLRTMNSLLPGIPPALRKRYLTSSTKKKIYAPGLLRMIISDPSEAVESETILPVIHENFEIIEEKKTGGDLLMMVLKDIAHNFTGENNHEAKRVLNELFEKEDDYLDKIDTADFIFGVYKRLF